MASRGCSTTPSSMAEKRAEFDARAAIGLATFSAPPASPVTRFTAPSAPGVSSDDSEPDVFGHGSMG